MRSSTVAGAALLAAVLFVVAVRDGHSAQLCMDSSFPRTVNGSLSFCGYNGTACCNATDDAAVRREFAAMNISGTPCGDVVKSILCARCNPYAGELFTVTTTRRTVPLLCSSAASSSSRLITNPASSDYCSKVWDTCKDVRIPSSPFFHSPNSSKSLTDTWQSASDFCASLGNSNNNKTSPSSSPCFDGSGAAFNSTTKPLPLNGMCLERIGNGSFLNMAPHPDGSNRVFLNNQAGKVFLATIPLQGSGEPMTVDLSAPFLDVSDEVHFDNEFGLLGLAFHPGFATNGRFFVSYSCDKTKSASCSGRCACNSDVGCDPAKLTSDNGALPCQFQSVVAEYTANGTLSDGGSSSPANATAARPTEVRRVLTMGLPFTTHHGGQILFGPEDGYMYFMMGDGGGVGDPWNFAQNKKTLLGKIIRIDAVYEEVDLIIKGGNYGWRVYEGQQLYTPVTTPGGNTSADSIDAIGPVMGYAHDSVNSNVGSASITGGYVYRSMVDPCLNGRYLYADLYAKSMWAGIESPEGSGMYNVSSLTFSCSKSSPIPCDAAAGSSLPSLGYIFSFGEDNDKDVYLLTSKGVYRVVDPAECNYACPIKSSAPGGRASSPAPSSAVRAGAPELPTLLAGVLLALMSLISV
ncbi:hypothetical protein PR202_ga28042 [Eleusine coracana subsp. coracana]|uniref:Glucose/Sorbosone dehydrogenase domain-containing protein n=1 Tax=Eleusine coracana subsp. coracana TaxID=191504 RepID=A0AAV5DGR4_ELECO|nr:hypothetical protein PR202_ga28042 [Eleusine coracana subsp. coracana]